MAINKSALRQALQKMKTIQPEIENTWLLNQLIQALVNLGKIPQIKGEKGDKPIAGVDYPIPKDGKDGKTPIAGVDFPMPKDGKKGDKGDKGDPGKDANITEAMLEADRSAEVKVEEHSKEFDHKLLHDSKELGSFKLDERTTQEGNILQIKGKKIIGVDMPRIPRQQFARPAKAHSRYRIQTITASTTIDPSQNVVLVDASSGNITITLYNAAGNEGCYTFFKRIDDVDTSGTDVTFSTPNSETIDYETLYRLVNRGSGCELFSDGSNFLIKHS